MILPGVKKDSLVIVVILVTALLLYGNTIRNGYSFDDTYVAQNNPKVMKGIAGIPEIFTSRYVDEEGNSFGYRPVTMATFTIEQELWGQNPHLGHLINALLYAINSILLFTVLRRVFRHAGLIFPLTITLLFLAHPLHTEVVASLKNRETLLSFLFGLVSLYCFLKWMESKRLWLIFAGSFCFILAFLSKQDVITYVAVLPLALYYSWQGNLLTTTAKGKFGTRLKRLNILRYLRFRIWFILAIICPVIFILINYHTTRPIYVGLPFMATIVFMIFYYIKNKPQVRTNRYRIISFFFLCCGTIFLLIIILDNITPLISYKRYFPIIILVCYAIFFFRLFEIKYKIHLKTDIKMPGISVSGVWIYLLISIVLLGIVGIVLYKFPNLYLPTENKIVYNFENPQFVGDTGYQSGPLAFYTLFFYLKKLIWPHPLGFYYGFKMIPEVSWLMPGVIFSVVFHVGIFIWAIYNLRKKHILSFAILYYLITISIFTNIVIKIPGIVGERLAFFPSLGFCIALAWGIFKMLKIPVENKEIHRKKLIQLGVVIVLILIPYSVKTITRNRDWKDYLTLYSHDIQYLANSAKANNVYASQLLKEAFNNENGIPSPEVQKDYLDLAVMHLQKTVEIDPTYKFAWNNLGFITYQYLDKKEEGITYLEKALQLDSAYAEARYNLGYAYKMQQQYDKAVYQYEQAMKYKPDNGLYYTELADVYYREGDMGKSFNYYKAAANKQPDSDLPFIGMGNIYWLSGDTLKAINSWEIAFKCNPENTQVAYTLWKYFTKKNNPKAAIFEMKAKEFRVEAQ